MFIFDSDSPSFMIQVVTILEPFKDWLILETALFFLYIFSCSFYMIMHMIKGWSGKKDGEKLIFSNKKKQITDFVIYEEHNLLWFGFNFVLVCVPVFCGYFVWVLESEFIFLYFPDAAFNLIFLTIVIGAMWLGSVIQFICLPKIYEYE
jgi:hypothetical protein